MLGKYGIRIKNYHAGSIFSYDLGIREEYDCTDVILTNSLFTEYMLENGVYAGHLIHTARSNCTSISVVLYHPYGQMYHPAND